MTIEEKLVNLLITKEYHISFAESCTGGMACAQIVNVPNASKVLNSSFITYSNEAKIKWVHVHPDTLEKFGAVSEEVAKEMAIGTAEVSDSDIGVGITGIAGPAGGTKQKPVGMVCFGFKIKDNLYTYTEHFSDQSRTEVRKSSVDFVIKRLLELI